MKCINHSLIFALILTVNLFSQNPFIDSSKVKNKDVIIDTVSQTETAETGSIAEQETTDSSAEIINPFFSDDELTSAPESSDEPEGAAIDIILDLSIGVSTTLFKAEPKTISTGLKPNFLFDLGVIVPFLQRLYAGVSVRFLQLTYSLSDSVPGLHGSYLKTDTDECMRFLSAPVNLGMRFELGPVVPYFYATFEPAYLTSASRYTVNKTYVVSPIDSATLYVESTDDKKTTKQRERHQIFLGGGIGLEISYGYGAVYLDGSFLFALLEPGTQNTSPAQTSSSMKYFPISLGIRFFL